MGRGYEDSYAARLAVGEGDVTSSDRECCLSANTGANRLNFHNVSGALNRASFCLLARSTSEDRMDPSHAFEALAGIRPGNSTVSEVASHYGSPTVQDTSDGGLFFSFGDRGVHVIVDSRHRAVTDPVVTEVRLTLPYPDEVPGCLRLGQPRTDATEAVRRSFLVTDEYEDAMYFRPSARDDLLASVEFLSAGVVVSIELIHQPLVAPQTSN